MFHGRISLELMKYNLVTRLYVYPSLVRK
jgi:hypothetical protein